MILVIGYGNTLRGDDGVGPHLARQLARENHDPNVQVEARHQLTLELAEPLSRSAYAVFIDVSTTLPPGRVSCRLVTPVLPDADGSASMTHHCTPANLLAAARILYGAAPPAVILSVGAASFAYTESFSPTVAEVLPAALDTAREFIATQRNLACGIPLATSIGELARAA